MTKDEAFEKINEITGGDCFRVSLEGVGLDGMFSAEQLRKIADVLDEFYGRFPSKPTR